jgi:hypothetical protein
LERQEAWLQVSAGHGPAECAGAVLKVVEKIQNDAAAAGLEIRTLDVEPGPAPGAAHSVLLLLTGTEGNQRLPPPSSRRKLPRPCSIGSARHSDSPRCYTASQNG